MLLLEVRKLCKSFGGVHAVRDCSFAVAENSLTALIGPNGAGKTTVFNVLTGLVGADSGEALFKGEAVTQMQPHEIARLGICRTFQLTRLFPTMTVMENLLLAKPHSAEGFWHSLLRPASAQKEERENTERCLEFLRLVGLEEKATAKAGELSYGQQKLVEIARALATEAELLLLDEPVAGVAPHMRQQIGGVLKQLKQLGRTVLLVEHDLPFVTRHCEHVIVMDEGRVIAEGKPTEITANPAVAEAYLGERVRL